MTPQHPAVDGRRVLLERLRDDRQDLVRVAGAVRELAQTLEIAQSSLAVLRRALGWLALVGGAATLVLSLRHARRRTPALLLTGLSLVLVRRWLSHPARDDRAVAAATPFAPRHAIAAPAPRAPQSGVV